MTLSPEKTTHTVALLGNPNSGKSSVFNLLTGLNQKTGNFPGVTVDKKYGQLTLKEGDVNLIDLPGTYSLHPNAQDERIVTRIFANPLSSNYPDAIIYVADIMQLEKHLLLLTQIKDLGLPVLLLLNMADLAKKEGLVLDDDALSKQFGIPVLSISARENTYGPLIKEKLSALFQHKEKSTPFYKLSTKEKGLVNAIRSLDRTMPDSPNFQNKQYTDHHIMLIAHHYQWLPSLSEAERIQLSSIIKEQGFEGLRNQIGETMSRYNSFTPIVNKFVQQNNSERANLTDKIDNIVTHKFLGPLIFFGMMFLLFQAIYSWAGLPMDLIEGLFSWAGEQVRANLPEIWLTDLLVDGVIAGLGGVLVFIPQIAILFFLIALLEEVGYMARAVFMFDRLMQRFGLNGRSIVAFISGGACAIPAIMSTRTISNEKERLLTILVTPWISCSARIPVYVVLIGFVVPSTASWMGFNAQGMAFMGLYLLGIVFTLLAAFVLKFFIKTEDSSFLMMELPIYKKPMARNIFLTVWEKVKAFVLEAGKVILVISIVLWFLASYSMPGQMDAATEQANILAKEQQLDQDATDNLVAAKRLEASFAGKFGKAIEPIIEPLGYDWKIGIALLTSFAAREVFVGTMATIYSIGSEESELRIRERMAKEINPKTQQPVYTIATALSLLVFYVFAMQCVATLAVVRRETKSWKWPILQFVFMTVFAYLASLLTYQVLV